MEQSVDRPKYAPVPTGSNRKVHFYLPPYSPYSLQSPNPTPQWQTTQPDSLSSTTGATSTSTLYSNVPLSPTSRSLKLGANFHPRQFAPTPVQLAGRPTYLLLATPSTKPIAPIPSHPFHVDQNPSTTSSATAAEFPKAGAGKSAAAFWKNLPGIRSSSGISEPDNSSKKLSRSQSITHFITGI